jgi:hypothetical protein
MKPQSYLLVVAILVAAILLLWPRTKQPPTPIHQESPLPAATVTGSESAIPSAAFPPLDGSLRSAVPAPEVPDIEVNPESPPEQTVAFQIARQQAMLKALERRLAAIEAQLSNSSEPAERETLQNHIQILRAELTNQQAVLRGLQE